MSGSATNFAGTLTGGIQDISALLPIIGTDQCEKHVGSALEGGFLYAVATPLSLFGSLGIVKAGISVLIASISAPKPSLSLPKLSFNEKWLGGISVPLPSLKFTPLPKLSFVSSRPLLVDFHYYKPSLKLTSLLSFTSSRRLLCGARVLDDAGFKLVGTVAPLIGMDSKCYKAESRLIEILEEKHIDTPENLSVDWRSAKWNISLVVATVFAALISGIPYLYLLLKDAPESIHSPWVFPLLRTVGSCLTTICCQFLIQSRVISLMKSRIIFMIMDQHLVDDLKEDFHDESILKEQKQFRWDERFPAEDCLWSLEQYLLSRHPSARRSHSFYRYVLLFKAHFHGLVHNLLSKVHTPAAQGIETHHDPHNSDVPEQWVRVMQQYEHPPRDVELDNVEPFPHSEDVLPFSNPDHILHALLKQHAEHFPTPRLHRVFTIISWLLLLVSLPASVAGYIGCFTLVTNSRSPGPLVWLGLEAALSALRILLWAWNPSFDERTGVEVRLKLTEKGPPITTHWDIDALHAISQVPLVPERGFLEQITPYTGPRDHFTSPKNVALYFVLTVNKERTRGCLLMMVLDLTDRTAITLYAGTDSEVLCFNTSIIPNTDIGEMVATIHWNSPIEKDHPSNSYVHDLARYYDSLLQSLNRHGPGNRSVARLRWKWSFHPNDKNANQQKFYRPAPLNLVEHDILRLQQSDEHHLKTRLMEIRGKWIVDGVEAMYRDGRNDCYLVVVDPTSNEAKRKLYAFNVLLVQGWTKRELAHLQLSAALEKILHSHVQQNAKKLANAERKNTFSLEWSYDLQKQRLERERAQVKAGRKTLVERRSKWIQNEFASIWQAGQAFLEEKWTAVIESLRMSFEGSSEDYEWFGQCTDETHTLVEKLKPRFARWNNQHSCERLEMEARVERISKADAKQLMRAYEYPESSGELVSCVYSRFVNLRYDLEENTFIAKVSSATVYDVYNISSVDMIRTVAGNICCRSLIRVDRDFIQLEAIPENDHLLFCSDSNHQEVDLPFIQRNRNRWWEQQKANSWTFYLSPRRVTLTGKYVFRKEGVIAHIMIFLETPTRLRLHILHCQTENDVELSIQGQDREIQHIHPTEIPKDNPRWQDYDLDWFEPGQHKLQLVVQTTDYNSVCAYGWYLLRDIVLEFGNDPSSNLNAQAVVSNLPVTKT